MNIEIIDLKINNINSVLKAVKHISNQEVDLIETPNHNMRKSLIILPGLGKFKAGMDALTKNQLNVYINEKIQNGSFIVGICLGMQLLGDASEESPGTIGLSLINGVCKKLKATEGEHVPNIGWAQVNPKNNFDPFQALSRERDFYFVHSYHFVPESKEQIIGETNFGTSNFVSAINTKRVVGFQFHPEKSASIGYKLIEEIVVWASNET
jgi:glutamine amidotransferase